MSRAMDDDFGDFAAAGGQISNNVEFGGFGDFTSNTVWV